MGKSLPTPVPISQQTKRFDLGYMSGDVWKSIEEGVKIATSSSSKQSNSSNASKLSQEFFMEKQKELARYLEESLDANTTTAVGTTKQAQEKSLNEQAKSIEKARLEREKLRKIEEK